MFRKLDFHFLLAEMLQKFVDGCTWSSRLEKEGASATPWNGWTKGGGKALGGFIAAPILKRKWNLRAQLVAMRGRTRTVSVAKKRGKNMTETKIQTPPMITKLPCLLVLQRTFANVDFFALVSFSFFFFFFFLFFFFCHLCASFISFGFPFLFLPCFFLSLVLLIEQYFFNLF